MNRANLKSFLHGSAASMIGVGTLGIMNYFIRRTLALNLSETDYGFFYSAYALVMVIMVFFDLGLGQSVIILMSKGFAENDLERARKVFTVVFITKLLLALAVGAVMLFLAPHLMHYYFKHSGSSFILILIFLLIPIQTFGASFLCVVMARKAFITRNVLLNIKIFIILAGIFFSIKSYGLIACIAWFILADIIFSLITFVMVKRYGIALLPFKTIKFSEFKNIFELSSWIAVSTAGLSAMYYLDTLCLTWLAGLHAVAVYNIALPIMQIAQSFFVFPVIFTPFVVEMWQNKDYAGIRRTCLIGSLLMFLTLPVFLFVGIYFAPDIITLLFSAKFVAAAPAITILWCGMVFYSIAGFNISALNSGNRQKSVAYMVIFCVIINFVLNIILIPRLGYNGAAIATAASYVIMASGSISNLMLTFRK